MKRLLLTIALLGLAAGCRQQAVDPVSVPAAGGESAAAVASQPADADTTADRPAETVTMAGEPETTAALPAETSTAADEAENAETAAPSGLVLQPPDVVERRVVADEMIIDASDVVVVDLADLPPATKMERQRLLGEMKPRGPELPISKQEAERRRQESLKLLPQENIQIFPDGEGSLDEKAIQNIGQGNNNGTLGNGTASHDGSNSCQGCALEPPDPEMAAGPNHVIAVDNVSFEIITRATGARVSFFFASFFATTPNCVGVFDPNVIYDEKSDRFILGIDANGTHYCIAANATPGNLNVWNLYSFQTVNSGTEFFDYPHAGVGTDGIYVGANMFHLPNFFQGRMWAVKKSDLYGGLPLTVAQANVGGESTPQPANIKGAFPAAGSHYYLTDDQFNGNTYAVWRWDNAIQIPPGTLTKVGVVDLSVPVGVPGSFPIPAPQLGGVAVDGGDYRVQDNEQRKGKLHMTTTIACNPGAGPVDCVRWAVIDPTVPSIVDMGVFASLSHYRIYADLAVDNCGDIAVGYTRSASNQFTHVYLTGRQPSDAAGLMQGELLCKAGEATYTGPFPRWGDYTGMTVSPDNTFFYLGEYGKSQLNMAIPFFTSANWGTFICSYGFGCGCRRYKVLYQPVQIQPVETVNNLTSEELTTEDTDALVVSDVDAVPRLLPGCPGPTNPDNIVKGLDFFETPPGGGLVDVGPIPAGFFCEEQTTSVSFGPMSLHGVPIATSPGNVLGPSDTVVERPLTVNIPAGLSGTTSIYIRGLSLAGDDVLTVGSCPAGQDRWRARVSLTSANQNQGTITINRPTTNGGTFDATFQVSAQVVFENVDDPAQRTAPMTQVDVVSTSNAEWATQPTNTNAVAHCGSIAIDSNGDGLFDDLDYTGTFNKMTNFWPGWPGGGGTQHTGPHPATLPPICP